MKVTSVLLFVCAAYFSMCAVAKEKTSALHFADTRLVVNGASVSLQRGRQELLRLDKVLFNYVEAESWTLESSDERSIVLRGRFPAHIDFYKHVSDVQPRYADLVISAVDGGFRLFSEPEWARQTTLQFEYLDDHFFGLSEPLQPDNRLSPDLVRGVINVDVVAEHAAIAENYASAFSSFFISSKGYGAFFDSFARGQYQFDINGRNQIHHDTGKLDWYLFPGKDGVEIHKAYFNLIGKPKFVPAWAMGPVGWRDQNDGGADEILSDLKQLSDMEIPFSSWFVDRPYSDGAHAWSKMNFSNSFRNPGSWIQKIREDYGLEFMTWCAKARLHPLHSPAYASQDVCEAWFAGSHCDVGAGRIALRWMLGEAARLDPPLLLNNAGTMTLRLADRPPGVRESTSLGYRIADLLRFREIDNSGEWPALDEPLPGTRCPLQTPRRGKVVVHASARGRLDGPGVEYCETWSGGA